MCIALSADSLKFNLLRHRTRGVDSLWRYRDGEPDNWRKRGKIGGRLNILIGIAHIS